MDERPDEERRSSPELPPSNATLTVFKSPSDAESAIRQLAKDAYDLGRVSMVGRDAGDLHAADVVHGKVQTSVPTAGTPSWAGIRGMLVNSGFIVVPSIGPLLVAGPLLTWIVQSMGTAFGPNKQDALAAGLHHLGIPEQSVLRCEAALRIGKVVVIAEGSVMMMILAREVFRRMPVEMIEQHLHPPD